MKNQCFGGEYQGEVYDQMLKRQTFRKQKRWWSAYILFYHRLTPDESGLQPAAFISASSTYFVSFLQVLIGNYILISGEL